MKYILSILLFLQSLTGFSQVSQDCKLCFPVHIKDQAVATYYTYFNAGKYIDSIQFYLDNELRIQSTFSEVENIRNNTETKPLKNDEANVWLMIDPETNDIYVMSLELAFTNTSLFLFYQDLFFINNKSAKIINENTIGTLATVSPIFNNPKSIRSNILDLSKYETTSLLTFANLASGILNTNGINPMSWANLFQNIEMTIPFTPKELGDMGLNKFEKNDKIDKIEYYLFYDEIKLGEKYYLSQIIPEFRIGFSITNKGTFWTSMPKQFDKRSKFLLEKELWDFVKFSIFNELLKNSK